MSKILQFKYIILIAVVLGISSIFVASYPGFKKIYMQIITDRQYNIYLDKSMLFTLLLGGFFIFATLVSLIKLLYINYQSLENDLGENRKRPLQNQVFLSQFLPDESNSLKPSIIKVRGKTLICGNEVYQIHNIASIGLVELTTTVIKPMPKVFVALPIIGILFLFVLSEVIKILGVLLITLGAWLIYQHSLNKINTRERYGMTIYTNAGTKTVVVSRSEDFIKRVILTLYSVMNSDDLKAINFNFETLDMSVDNSIAIGTPIVSGTVKGEVVNEV